MQYLDALGRRRTADLATTSAVTAAVAVGVASAHAYSDSLVPQMTVVEKNLGNPANSGSFTISGLSGLTVGRPVLVHEAVGPYTGKGDMQDEAEMDQVIVAGIVTAADTIKCWWHVLGGFIVTGNFKFQYLVV